MPVKSLAQSSHPQMAAALVATLACEPQHISSSPGSASGCVASHRFLALSGLPLLSLHPERGYTVLPALACSVPSIFQKDHCATCVDGKW